MHELPEIIGIAGTNGAGKDTLGHLLERHAGYHFVSLSDTLRAELDRQGLAHTRENLRTLSTKWASEEGPESLSRRTIADYEAAKQTHNWQGLVIGSIRRPAEAEEIQRCGGKVVWVDAERATRYERLVSANRNRHEDTVSFAEWCEAEDIEMTPVGGDPMALNMAGTKAVSDIFIDNNYATQQDYEAHLDELFGITG